MRFFTYENIELYCNSVLNKDCLKQECLDLIIASPPYNVGIDYNSNSDLSDHISCLKWCEKWLKNCYFWAKDGARFCLNIPLDKNKGGQQSVGADLTHLAPVELILVLYKGERKRKNRGAAKTLQKLFSYENDLVLDPFSGSGTTMLEAYANNRRFIGIELDSSYCELSKQRFLNENSGVLKW